MIRKSRDLLEIDRSEERVDLVVSHAYSLEKGANGKVWR
jgi:hypothetical protein